MKRFPGRSFFLAPLPFVLACTSPTALPDEGVISFTLSGVATPNQRSLAPILWEEQKACTQYTGYTTRTVEIEVLSGPFICTGNSSGVWAAGCTKPGRIQVDTHHYENALSHEFIHLIEMLRGHIPDYNHSGPLWARCDWRNRSGQRP